MLYTLEYENNPDIPKTKVGAQELDTCTFKRESRDR